MEAQAVSDVQRKRKREALDDDDNVSIKQEPTEQEGAAALEDGDSDSESEDDSDDDGSEEDGDYSMGECKYFESSERYPSCLAYDPEFREIEQSLTGIPKEVIKIIDESGCKSERSQNCRTNAEKLACIPAAERDKIALLGNTGVGKSSLINALLDVPNLAKAVSAGQSCTHVATEYQGPFDEQETKFAAFIEFFDEDQIRAQVEKLLQDYNTWNFERPDDMDQEEEQDLKSQASTAFDTFRSLFCDRQEMSSIDAATDFLDSLYMDTEANAADMLCSWCGDLLEGFEDVEGEYWQRIDMDEQADFQDAVSPLMFSTSVYAEPALWPLVRQVQIGIQGSRVLQHVSLVDLPGMDDTNRLRASTCVDILGTCDWIWVVAKTNRIITDTSVDNLLWRYGKTFKIAVVCTGIDENLEPQLAQQLVAEGENVRGHDQLLNRERKLRRTIKRCTKKIETRQAKLEGRNKIQSERKGKPLTEAAREKLRAQVEQQKKELASAQEELPGVALERFHLLAGARNAFTTRRMQEEKAEHLPPNKTLQVFCVSNTHYDALKGARTINGLCLSPDATGIPALRSFIHRAAAPYLRKTVEEYINHSFTVFMQGLAMWANSYAVEGRLELLEQVKKPQSNISPILEKYRKESMALGENSIVSPLASNLSNFLKRAKAAVEKKRKWHWSTMRCFVRHGGNHSTSVAPKQSWNESFMEAASDMIKANWDEYLKKQAKNGSELEEELVKLVQDTEIFIQGHPAHVNLPMDRLRTMFQAQEAGITQACGKHKDGLGMDLRNIYLDLTQDRCTGYFTSAMKDVYDTCEKDKGHGVKARTLTSLDEHLARPEKTKSPFRTMSNKFNTAIGKDVRVRNKALFDSVNEILKKIHSQLQEIVQQKSDDNAEEWLRVKFREYLAVAAPKFEDIQLHLALLKQKHGVEAQS